MASPIHTDISRLLVMLAATGKNYDIEKIQRAFEYANALHEGQRRVSGEAYISHPVAVAEIVGSLELDTDSICAALLHDTVEDCADKTNLKEIEKKFGSDVALLVDGLTKIVMLQVDDKEEAHIENLRKMLLAMSNDIRVIFIKLCDRLHNMRTLDAKPENKRRLTALETMQVYAPLAHRLGIHKLKLELENLSISYLDPIGYAEVKEDIEKKYGQNVGFIENIRRLVEEKLHENHISFELEGRIKSVYSVYRKMYNQNKSFDEIYDFYALRVIVDNETECYSVLGYIHEMFRSIPGRFKDYISTPKPNMYRSLHTTVIGQDGIPFEVQIRTHEMHHFAEYGMAAHWKYKSGSSSREEMNKKLEWIARLIETENGTRDPDEFLHALKTDIFQDEVFVFTPKGDVIALPQGATVIDFAYAIHSAVGNKMIGAKINGMIVPIDRSPANGEIVEIITASNSKGPSRDWLNIVRTSEARNKIRQWFKKETRVENVAAGKAIVDAEIKKYAKSLTEAEMAEVVNGVSKKAGFATADDLYNTIGFGGISISKIAIKLHDEYVRTFRSRIVETPVDNDEQARKTNENAGKPKNLRSNSGIIIDGERGCQVKFAKCCNPLPGDRIVGFITRGFGVSVHKSDCPNVLQSRNEENLSRWVRAEWERVSEGSVSNETYEARLQIKAEDDIGVIAGISVALADMRVSITQINTVKDKHGDSIISVVVACRSVSHYDSIVSRLRSVPKVLSVIRG